MADLTQTIAIVFQGKDNASDEIAKVSRGLADVEQTGQGATQVSNQLDGIAGKLGLIGSAISAAVGGLSIGKLVQEYVNANIELERFTRAVTAISGSSETAGKELEYVRGTANRLGLDIRTTSDAWVQLSAAAKGTSLEGEGARRVFEAVSSSMALLGKSSADTQGALLAIQQIISKGTVSSEELRGQLGERLPGAFQIAARAVGVTTQELGKMLETGQLTANEFLPKFATELENTFGRPQQVDTYTAAVARFGNAFQISLQEVGKEAGGLGTDLLDKLAYAVRIVGLDVQNQIGSWRNLLDVIRGGSWDTFVERQKLLGLSLEGTAATLNGPFNESLAETQRLLRQTSEAAKDLGDSFEKVETARFARQYETVGVQLKKVDEAFKDLGINPDKAREGVERFINAFDRLAASPSVSGGQLLAGLEGVLKNIEDKKYLPKLKDQLQAAWEEGRLTGDELAKAFGLISKEQEGLDKKLGITTKSITDQAKEAEKAAEKAAQWRLEIEKLASNERIKTLEFKANLDIANVQEQTKRIQAAFESLDNTVNSTADVITKAFGLLAGGNDLIDSSVRNKLFSQLDIENANRERALAKQAELTDAQIKVLRAQAEQLTRGDALIKIDGTGLAPHLEAFMWEVLKAVQVRGNRDGMKLLLGV